MRSEDLGRRGSSPFETGDFGQFLFVSQDVSILAVVVTIKRLSITSVSWTAPRPYRIAAVRIDREEHAFMRCPVGNGSPKSWWTLHLWERAGRFSRSRLVLGVLMLALPGCMTTGHQSAKGLDPSVRSAPPRGVLNDPPTNPRATPPGFLENPIVRGQDPGADQDGGPQDAGSAAVVAPAGSAPPLPQPNPPAPAPPASDLVSAPPGFALDSVVDSGGATPAASPGSTLASAAAGRPLGNPANTQLSGLNPIARNRLQRAIAPG